LPGDTANQNPLPSIEGKNLSALCASVVSQIELCDLCASVVNKIKLSTLCASAVR